MRRNAATITRYRNVLFRQMEQWGKISHVGIHTQRESGSYDSLAIHSYWASGLVFDYDCLLGLIDIRKAYTEIIVVTYIWNAINSSWII